MSETAQAGRELDAEVAVKIFGWHWYDHGTIDRPRRSLMPPDEIPAHLRDERGTKDVPHYSTEISAAWGVLQKFAADTDSQRRYWYCVRLRWTIEGRTGEPCTDIEIVLHATPVDVCVAALKSIKADGDAAQGEA